MESLNFMLSELTQAESRVSRVKKGSLVRRRRAVSDSTARCFCSVHVVFPSVGFSLLKNVFLTSREFEKVWVFRK
jgi:hypothetical protein